MQSRPRATHQPLPIRFPLQQVSREALPSHGVAGSTVSDRMFLTLLRDYRASGGLARAAEVVTWIERKRGLDAGQLAAWRADRRVVCFDWQQQTWLPRFQFLLAGPLPNLAVGVVLAELRTVFD
jgi:hypothetical protein